MFVKSFNKINYVFMSVAISLCYGQEIPNDFYDFQKRKLIIDSGYNWEENTTFGPVRYKRSKKAKIPSRLMRDLELSFQRDKRCYMLMAILHLRNFSTDTFILDC